MTQLKAVLITFGDGDLRYVRAGRRLVNEARATGLYEQSLMFDLKWLAKTDPELFRLARGWIAMGDIKGVGYWIWKSAAVLWATRQFPGRLIHYMDAGHVILQGQEPINVLQSWLTEGHELGSLAWCLPETKEKEWTKRETLELLDPERVYADSPQVEAGFFMLRHDLALNFASQMRYFATLENGRYLTGESWKVPNPEFQAPRYDQSIHSLLWKKNRLHFRPTETYPLEKCKSVFAARHASGFEWIQGRRSMLQKIEFSVGKIHKFGLISKGRFRRLVQTSRQLP